MFYVKDMHWSDSFNNQLLNIARIIYFEHLLFNKRDREDDKPRRYTINDG